MDGDSRPLESGDSLPRGPFRRTRGLECGLTDEQLRSSRFVHIRRDCYVPLEVVDDPEVDVRAALAVMPAGVALYGRSAAQWYGLPVSSPDEVHIIAPAAMAVPRRRPGIVTHEGLGEHQVQVKRGVLVTSPVRTWLDLSLELSSSDLVVAGDAMVTAGLVTPDELVAAADGARRRRHVVSARTAARCVRSGADSPQETRLRLILVEGGLDEPVVNPDVGDDVGGWIGRPDLAYEELKVAIQYEGDVHRVDRRQWRADIARDAVFADNGWEVVRVTADDLRKPWYLCERVRRSLERQRRRLPLDHP